MPPQPLSRPQARNSVRAQYNDVIHERTDIWYLTCALELELACATDPQDDELLEVRGNIVAGEDRLTSQAHLDPADGTAGCNCFTGPTTSASVKEEPD